MDGNSTMPHQKCLIFGTGSVAENIVRVTTSLGLLIEAYLDNDRRKWHTLKNGLPVLPPTSFIDYPSSQIIIAGSFHEEIEAQLLAFGVPAENIRTFPGYLLTNGIYNASTCTKLPHTWDTLILAITQCCNLRCAHCIRSNSGYNPTWTASLKTFTEYLSRFKAENFRECCVSGFGEATLVKNFAVYLRCAKDMGWDNLNIITNGTCQNKTLLDTIVEERLLKSIAISIESAHPQMFERIRGFPFQKFLYFLSLLRDARRRTGSPMTTLFNVTFGEMNLDHLPEIIELATEYDIQTVRFHPLISLFSPDESVPDGKICTQEYILNNLFRTDVIQKFIQVRDKAQQAGISISDNCGILESLADKAPTGAMATISCCVEPYRIVRVEPDGAVYPCCQMDNQYSLGNISQKKFEEIWQGASYLRLLTAIDARDLRYYPGCKACFRTKGDLSCFIHSHFVTSNKN